MYGLLLQEPVEGSFKCEPGKEPGLDIAVMKYGNCTCHPYNPDVLYCPQYIIGNETVTVRIKRGANVEVDCGDDVDREKLQDLLGSCPKIIYYISRSIFLQWVNLKCYLNAKISKTDLLNFA